MNNELVFVSLVIVLGIITFFAYHIHEANKLKKLRENREKAYKRVSCWYSRMSKKGLDHLEMTIKFENYLKRLKVSGREKDDLMWAFKDIKLKESLKTPK